MDLLPVLFGVAIGLAIALLRTWHLRYSVKQKEDLIQRIRYEAREITREHRWEYDHNTYEGLKALIREEIKKNVDEKSSTVV